MFTRRAPVASVNAEARTAEVVWSTGARVKRSHWIRGDFYEELSLDPKHVRMGRLQNKAPLLNAHNSWNLSSVLGVVESARIENGQGIASVRFSERKEVDPIFQDVRDAILTHTSAGYRVYKMERLAEPAEDGLPIYRAVDWEPYEISVVPMGADDAATFRGADGKAGELFDVEIMGERDMHPKQYQMTRGLRAPETGSGDGGAPAPVTGDQPNGAQPPADQSRGLQPPPAPDLSAVRAEAAAAERTRATEIRKAAKIARLPDAFADGLVERGISLDVARGLIIDEMAKAEKPIEGANPTVTVTRAQEDKWQEGAQNWLIQRSGMGKLFAGENGKLPDPGEFRGMTLLDLARDALELRSFKVRGLDKMALVGNAFTFRANITQSTSDFAILLENTMHKMLLAQYNTTPDTWSRWCGVGSVSDFRPHPRYRLGMFGKLDKLAENGEFKNKALQDAEKELIAVGTVGNMINISRHMVVNDDMGGFARLATMLGRAAKLSIEIDAYASLAENSGAGPDLNDGNPIFHSASHKNVAAVAAYPSVTAVDAIRSLMARQKDPWGNEYLDLRPSVVLCATELGGQFRVINAAEFDPDGGDKRTPNKVRGIFKDIVDTPRLSGNGWYVFDPMHPVIEVAFLDGNQEPLLESKDGWRTDGVEWKVRIDYGVGGVDFRGAARNTGAAPA